MAFLLYEQESATATAKTVSDLSIPARATDAQLQADTQDIRYTMDDATTPTLTSGNVLKAGLAPETFLVEDVKNIRFVRGAGSNGVLNVHWFGGRDV